MQLHPKNSYTGKNVSNKSMQYFGKIRMQLSDFDFSRGNLKFISNLHQSFRSVM